MAVRPCIATFRSEAYARNAVRVLMDRSQWFEVTPLPDGWWEIAVKAENRDLMFRLVNNPDEVR